VLGKGKRKRKKRKEGENRKKERGEKGGGYQLGPITYIGGIRVLGLLVALGC